MGCLLEILRCILFCGEDDDPGRFSDTRSRGYYIAASAREDAGTQNRLVHGTSPQRSPATPPDAYRPSRAAPQYPLPSPPRSLVFGVTDSVRPSSDSVDSAKGWQDRRSPEKPPKAPQQSSKPCLLENYSKKSSPSLPPSTKVPSTPLPSSRASPSSPLLSKASPAPFPSSKAPPTSPSLLTSSKAPPSSPSLPPPSKAPPTTLPSSKASPSPPALSSKTYLPSSKPDEGKDTSPELSGIKQKSMLPRYEIPEHLKDMIKKDKVPPVLMRRLTPATYGDYFATLLYAEDFYEKKWSKFLLSEVTLELYSRAAFENARKTKKTNKCVQMNKKDFVAFEIDSVPERRPFLLSRDFVFVRPSGKMTEPFKGILFRVVNSSVVLVEFEDDFHEQHLSTRKYDVNFSFNRVCLKRSHHAVSAAMDPSLHDILFPDARSDSSFLYLTSLVILSPGSLKQGTNRILNHKGTLPYLIQGPLSTILSGHRSTTLLDHLSSTGTLIQDTTLQIYRTAPHCRILICAPRNRTCDALMRSLRKEIPESKLFRANAAFRDYDLVPDDILPACLYEGECFTCPPLDELRDFKVITSTFMSSFRLHNAGINADHFTHIFLVDASSATEPEAVVALANLVSKKTVVVVTGSSKDLPHRVRSDIARRHGLKKSYFHRLLEREPYLSRDPKFITHIGAPATAESEVYHPY